MYKILRFFINSKRKTELIRKGLTLEEAQKYCQNPMTKRAGMYFDAYTKEK